MKVSEIVERPGQYWLEDGVVDLTLGLQWLLVGAIFLPAMAIEHRSSAGQMYAVIAPLLWGAASMGTMWGLKRWKARLVAPRTGYVALDVWGARQGNSWVAWLAAALTFILMGLLLVNPARSIQLARDWIGSGFALFMAVNFLWMAWRYKMPGYLWVAALSLGIGAWMWKGADAVRGPLIVLTWIGGALLIIGALRLRRFLAEHPIIEDHGE